MYNLSVDDLLALHDYRLQIDPQLRRGFWMRRFIYLFGFTLFSLGSFWLTYKVAFLYGFAILGIIVFYAYPYYLNLQLRRKLEKTYGDEDTRRSLTGRILEISGRGLAQPTNEKRVHIGWDDIDDMGVIPSHAFISIGGRTSWIILPASGFVEGDFKTAVDEIKAFLGSPPAADGDLPKSEER